MAAPLHPLQSLIISSYKIPSHGGIPNSSVQERPLLIYHSAFPSSTSASIIESHLKSIGVVVPQWRFTMYDFTHFHSTSHEVLCISNGTAKLLFGGEHNPQKVEVIVNKGDVIVIPAGVGHRLLDDIEGGFEMVGSYPEGCQWDTCHGNKDEQSLINSIKQLEWFGRDPIYGDEGPVLKV